MGALLQSWSPFTCVPTRSCIRDNWVPISRSGTLFQSIYHLLAVHFWPPGGRFQGFCFRLGDTLQFLRNRRLHPPCRARRLRGLRAQKVCPPLHYFCGPTRPQQWPYRGRLGIRLGVWASYFLSPYAWRTLGRTQGRWFHFIHHCVRLGDLGVRIPGHYGLRVRFFHHPELAKFIFHRRWVWEGFQSTGIRCNRPRPHERLPQGHPFLGVSFLQRYCGAGRRSW